MNDSKSDPPSRDQSQCAMPEDETESQSGDEAMKSMRKLKEDGKRSTKLPPALGQANAAAATSISYQHAADALTGAVDKVFAKWKTHSTTDDFVQEGRSAWKKLDAEPEQDSVHQDRAPYGKS